MVSAVPEDGLPKYVWAVDRKGRAYAARSFPSRSPSPEPGTPNTTEDLVRRSARLRMAPRRHNLRRMAMTAPAFDTLATARDLEAAGLERRQAEAVVSAIGNAGDRATTKADLAALRAGSCRALWIQGGAIVAALLAGIAPALAGSIAGAGR